MSLLLFGFGGCARDEPPLAGTASKGVGDGGANAAALPDAGIAIDAGAGPVDAGADAGAGDDANAANAVDAGALPQTHDKPTHATFEPRARALWDAIQKDDPDAGLAAFFPVAAYEQTKAVAFPASDWRRRLVANFARDVHALHKDTAGIAGAHFDGVEIPNAGRWVDPGDEGNKTGYYRVYGTRVWIVGDDGKRRPIPVSSLISWRGEWYVVHLTGFK